MPRRAKKEAAIDRITVESGKMGGVPCIRGMRMPVATVARMLRRGMSYAEILDLYPDLEPADLDAVCVYVRENRALRRPGNPGLAEGERTVPLYIRVPESLAQRVTAAAEAEGVPMAEWARDALTRALEDR